MSSEPRLCESSPNVTQKKGIKTVRLPRDSETSDLWTSSSYQSLSVCIPPASHENLQTLQLPAGVIPDPFMLQVWSFDREQNDPWTDPDKPELFVIDKEARLEGNDGGRGFDRLLESRCSSTRELKEEIDDGIWPESDVDERSLQSTAW